MIKSKQPKVKWSEVDDFFLQENVMKYNDEELGKKLGKSTKQVVARIKKLGIDIEALTKIEKRKQALKNLSVGSAGDPNANIVAMTSARSISDQNQGKVKKDNAKRIEEMERELAEMKGPESPQPETKGHPLVDQFKVK